MLVVDDSPVVRMVLSTILSQDSSIGEVYTAPNGRLALKKVAKLDPDVVTLDVEMPELNGLATLRRIMDKMPRPVIMVSVATHEGTQKTLQALELGAVDFIPKPTGRLSWDIASIGAELREKIHAVAGLGRNWQRRRCGISIPAVQAAPARPQPVVAGQPPQIIAMGASTGGTEAIARVLADLPPDFPSGIVMVMHLPALFMKSFVARLRELCAIDVKEAADHDMIRPGRALLAPGHSHMVVKKCDLGAYVEFLKTPPVSGHRPSVDVLFDSVADTYGWRAAAVLLTGMGRDGAAGMRRLHDQGAFTLAQSEESCVVFGMPKAAIDEGSVSLVTPLSLIGKTLHLAALGQIKRRGVSMQQED